MLSVLEICRFDARQARRRRPLLARCYEVHTAQTVVLPATADAHVALQRIRQTALVGSPDNLSVALTARPAAFEVDSPTHALDDTPIRSRCPSTLALNASTSRSRTGNGCA